KVAIGTHKFPFSVRLPADLPPTMKEEIVYTIEAHLNCPGMLSFNEDAASVVEVLDTLPFTQQPTPQQGIEQARMQGTPTPSEGIGNQGVQM
ncbi:unnamed protein product, partial [Ectocarpus sp. 4 AP-2014]